MSGAAIAVMVARARRHIVHHFTDAGATAPDRAVPFQPGRRRIERRMFRRMVKFGAIREAPAGLYWLDRDRLDDFRAHMRMRAVGAVALVGAAIAGAIALGA